MRDLAMKEAIKNKEDETGVKVNTKDHNQLKVIKKTLRNKFNYNQRQSQTMNNLIRERGVTTEPPPSDSYTGTITQWEIYDAYLQEYLKEKRKQEEGKASKNKEKEA